MSSPAANAKKFLVDRILDQANRDGISLDPVETTMLGFSEATAGSKQMETAAIFERDYDDQQYETKIAGLVRRAHDRDVAEGTREAWETALADLGGADLYLIVMLQQACVWSKIRAWLDWRLLWAFAPIIPCVAIGMLIAFTSFGARLIPNEFLRLLVFLLCLFAPFAIERFRGGKTPRTGKTRY